MQAVGVALAAFGRWVELLGQAVVRPGDWLADQRDGILWGVVVVVCGVAAGWLVVVVQWAGR